MSEREHPDEAELIKKIKKSFETREVEPHSFPERVMAFKFISNELQIKPNTVYYPGCAVDVSPVEGFSESKVIFADKDEKSIEALKKAGHDAVCADATNYVLENKIDLLVLINPGVAPDGPAANLKDRGYIVCNDYFGTATDLKNNSEFTLVGVADINQKEQGVSFEKERAGLYWETINTDEEFLKKNPVLFEMCKKLVDRYASKTEDIVIEYQKLYEKFYNPDLKASIDPATQTVFFPLPRKVGGVDSFFVYQKKQLSDSITDEPKV